jgi:predicted DNA-binding ribbon-helix-helix protein
MAKRSVTIAGHRTSIALEDPFWDGLGAIAHASGRPVAGVIADIDRGRDADTNLSAAIRLFVLAWYRERAR